jgi:hypothetical protein
MRGNDIRVGTTLINLLDCCPFVYVTSPAYEPKVKTDLSFDELIAMSVGKEEKKVIPKKK